MCFPFDSLDAVLRARNWAASEARNVEYALHCNCAVIQSVVHACHAGVTGSRLKHMDENATACICKVQLSSFR